MAKVTRLHSCGTFDDGSSVPSDVHRGTASDRAGPSVAGIGARFLPADGSELFLEPRDRESMRLSGFGGALLEHFEASLEIAQPPHVFDQGALGPLRRDRAVTGFAFPNIKLHLPAPTA